jgi:hypothetical protein
MAGDFNSRTESSEAQNFANIAERIRTEFNDKEHALKTILNSDQVMDLFLLIFGRKFACVFISAVDLMSTRPRNGR